MIDSSTLVRGAVRDLDPYEWELSTEEVARRSGLPAERVIRFDLNTSPYAPASWDRAMQQSRREAMPNEYFDTAYAELTPLLARYCGVAPDQIVVGAGADEVLDIIAKTFLDNGDAAVLTPPTYSMYAIVSAQMGATLRSVPLGDDFGPDVAEVLRAASGAKVLWHCNPNSPTGNATPRADFARLVGEAPCMVVVDEAYAEFAGCSAVDLIAQHPNLIVVRTMSKAFGMAGMRLACAVGAPEVVAMLHRVRPPNSVSRVTARVGAAALRDLDGMRANVSRILREREPLADALPELGAKVHPSVTNFLLTGWGSPANAQAVADYLETRGMVVRNFADHPLLPGHLRITVRSAEENARLVGALAERVR
ncbi:MAG: histidinol-phosphate transaminase [Candidatus Dormibacteraceae bacterium]